MNTWSVFTFPRKNRTRISQQELAELRTQTIAIRKLTGAIMRQRDDIVRRLVEEDAEQEPGEYWFSLEDYTVLRKKHGGIAISEGQTGSGVAIARGNMVQMPPPNPNPHERQKSELLSFCDQQPKFVLSLIHFVLKALRFCRIFRRR